MSKHNRRHQPARRTADLSVYAQQFEDDDDELCTGAWVCTSCNWGADSQKLWHPFHMKEKCPRCLSTQKKECKDGG